MSWLWWLTVLSFRSDALCCSFGRGWYSASLDGDEIFRGDSGFKDQESHSFEVSDIGEFLTAEHVPN
jgi:hypothetical protein